MPDNIFSILEHIGNIGQPPTIRLGTEGILNEEECIVILYANWSNPALLGAKSTIVHLSELHYPNAVYLVDQDSLSPQDQFLLLGELGHGWGKIFIYRQGIIVQKFTGKNAPWDFSEFIG